MENHSHSNSPLKGSSDGTSTPKKLSTSTVIGTNQVKSLNTNEMRELHHALPIVGTEVQNISKKAKDICEKYSTWSKRVYHTLLHISAVDLESLSVHLNDAIQGSTQASELGGNVDIRGGWHVFIRVAQAALGELDQLISSGLPEVSGEKHQASYVERMYVGIAIERFLGAVNPLIKNVTYLTQILQLMNSVQFGDKQQITEVEIKILCDSCVIPPFWYSYEPGLDYLRRILERAKESAAYAADDVQNEGAETYNSLFAFAKGGLKSVFVTDNDQFAHKKASEQMLKILWRLPEDPILSALIGVVFPFVHTSVTVHVPRPDDQGGKIKCQFIMNRPIPFGIPAQYVAPGQSVTEIPFDPDRRTEPLRVILNFHGGGFIAGSPKSHETYLREWVAATDCLLVSVDYQLAPDKKWPFQLEECFYIYNWLIDECPLGINISSIILTGDSAGANLAFTTTVKIIQEGKPVPDGIWAAYPALDMNFAVSPSRVVFINDVLLPFHFLLIALESYLPKGVDPCNPLISPVAVSDEVLLQFPRFVTIASAGLDPLLDDGIKMVKRFEQLNLPIRHKIYELLPHGYLQFATPMIPEAFRAKNQSTVEINEMFLLIEEKTIPSTTIVPQITTPIMPEAIPIVTTATTV